MAADPARIEFLPDEWWNGGFHVARVIGSMVLQHREIGSTYPEELEPDEWMIILGKIGEPLMAYAGYVDGPVVPPEVTKAARESLELFAQWFDKLWD